MAVTSTLAVTAFEARNAAREQRREAEGLVAFMLGDLKDKLEPIGRLDALDGVGSRVLAYYQKQGTSELSDAALSQRSKALSLMAQVADARGDVEGSLKLYREAMAGTAKSVRRNPEDPQAIFDHAQNVFYIGEIAHSRGDLKAAETSLREYQRLAGQMVRLQPDSLKFRMEGQYAATNLGVVLSDQRRFDEAAAQFRTALVTMQAIATADPTNREYRQGVAESFAWLGDAERAAGRYGEAIAARQRGIDLLTALLNQTGDVQFRQRLIPARRTLGLLYAERGQRNLGIEQERTAIAEADRLATVERNNTQWLEYGFRARVDLAKMLLLDGQRVEAAQQTASACDTVHGLLQRDSTKPEWRKGLLSCLVLRARLAQMGGANDQALSFAQQALAVTRAIHTSDKFADASRLARAFRIIGDMERARGNADRALSAWESGLAAIPAGVPELPDEMAEHAALLQRLGRSAEAQPLTARLNSMGYRLPV